MSRKKRVYKKTINPDQIYNSKLISQFINKIMKDGKKNLAQKILYDSFDLVKEKTKKDPLEVFEKALENVIPQLELKSKRIGGANYQIPYEVKNQRKFILAFRWIIQYARLRNGKSMVENLANELIDASNNTGAAVKKKENIHKMAAANKAFVHYRW